MPIARSPAGGCVSPLRFTPAGAHLAPCTPVMERARGLRGRRHPRCGAARAATFGLASALATPLRGERQDRHQQGPARQLGGVNPTAQLSRRSLLVPVLTLAAYGVASALASPRRPSRRVREDVGDHEGRALVDHGRARRGCRRGREPQGRHATPWAAAIGIGEVRERHFRATEREAVAECSASCSRAANPTARRRWWNGAWPTSCSVRTAGTLRDECERSGAGVTGPREGAVESRRRRGRPSVAYG